MNTKEKLIEESLKVFLEYGYDNFSMRDVSQAVGIKQPTIYHYFEDKLDLFRECLRSFFEKWHLWLAQSTNDEDLDLQSMIHNTCLSFAMDQDIVEMLYGVRTLTGQYRLVFDALTYCPECLHYMTDFNAEYFKVLDELVQKAKTDGQIRMDVTTNSIYTLLGSLIEGTNIMRLTDPDLDFAQQSESIFAIIWNGLQEHHTEETLTP